MTKPEPWEIFKVLSPEINYIFSDERGRLWCSMRRPEAEKGRNYWDNSPRFGIKRLPSVLNFELKEDWKTLVLCRDDYAEQLGEKVDSTFDPSLQTEDGLIFLCGKCNEASGNKISNIINKCDLLEKLLSEKESIKKKIPFNWEFLESIDPQYLLARAKVINGWIVQTGWGGCELTCVFVPDKNHEWELE